LIDVKYYFDYIIISVKNIADLENERIKEKHDSLRMEVIESLVKEFSNDSDLGESVRKFVNIKENTKQDLK
jgi:hypothetical protein